MMTKTLIFCCLYPLPQPSPRGKGPVNSAIGGKNSEFQYLINDKEHKVKFFPLAGSR